MTAEVAARTARFLRWLVREHRCGAACVGFYGGEPRLNLEACVLIMEEMARFAAQEGIFIEFPVTSNGSLLAEIDNQAFFDHASAFHLTLEGAQAGHDAVRRSASGQGSYRRIMAGISRLVELGTRIVIRVHQNRLDSGSWLEVLDDLAAAGLHPQARATIYTTSFATRSRFADPGQCRQDLAQVRLDALEQEQELVRIACSHRLAPLVSWQLTRPSRPLTLQPTGCLFAGCTSFAVDVNGELYKCPDDLSPQARIGRIDDGGEPRWRERFFDILGTRWWPDSTCASCQYLPVCGAGCTLREPPQSTRECATHHSWYYRIISRYVEHYLASGGEQ
jgi:radical SAM protein with 4Fe4S-binding SPASM domain